MSRILRDVAFLLLLIAPGAAGALDLVKDGRPVCTLVVPDGDAPWDRVAAGWVQEYVEKSTGAKLPIVAEKAAPAGALVSVGHTNLAKAAGIGTDDLKYDGCKVIVRGNVLYLLGRDTPGFSPKATGYEAGARGTCRAATKFLEDAVGVRWFVPVPEGERVPKARDLRAPDDLTVSFNPAFAFGHGRYIYGAGPASFANNFRTSVLMKSYGGHSYYSWVPEKKYFKDHPEYFAMMEGKRTGAGNHLCTTNPAVRELLKQGLFEQFEKGYEWVALGQTDGYQRCQCPACEALDDYRNWYDASTGETREEFYQRLADHPCERLHLTHKWLIDEAKKKYPDRKVHLLVYCPTSTPSKKFDYYGDNVVLEICATGRLELVDLWKGKAPSATLYVCWFDETSSYLGMDCGYTPAEISQIIRFLHERGIIGMYFGGGGSNWGFMGPTYYTLGRMMGDPSLDYRVLVTEYCEGMYGKAAREMQDFFELLYSRLTLKQVLGASAQDMQILRYPPDFLTRLEKLLDDAVKKADAEREKNFIRLTRDQLDFDKLLTRVLMAYRMYGLDPNPANWEATRSAVNAFDAFRERIVHYDDAYASRWFPGHANFCNFLTSGGNETSYYTSWASRRKDVLAKPLRGTVIGYYANYVGPPLTLNFDRPPVKPVLKVGRAAKPPALDGVLDDAEWAGAERQAISPMTANQEQVPTYVRALYDDKNLYIAFECDEPVADKIVAYAVGRDGPVWKMDCGEILLAPDRSNRRFYHYIIAPAQGALYDNRTGFKTLTDEDASWNGDCAYGFKIDSEKKRWCLEVAIPFAALGAGTPGPGASWLGNFGRERQAAAKRETPDLFLWSQDKTLGFTDPAAFGKIEFK